MATQLRIPALDLAIIIVYLIAILAIGVLTTRRVKVTGSIYFLAGRSLPWGIVGAALFASNISTIHLVGLTVLPVIKKRRYLNSGRAARTHFSSTIAGNGPAPVSIAAVPAADRA